MMMMMVNNDESADGEGEDKGYPTHTEMSSIIRESSWFEFDDGYGEDVCEAEGEVDDQSKSAWSVSRRLPCYVDSQGRKIVEALLSQVDIISP